MKIGFIGLGNMGAPMAANLIRAGFDVAVHNRTREREVPLAELGAARAENPSAAAAGSEAVIVIVSDTPDVRSVLFSPDGVATTIEKGALVIDMSTIDPKDTREFATKLAGQGVGMLDAPVSGGTEGAEQGTISIMAGGSPQDFERALPIFEALGKTITHVGPSGSGQMTKAINQVIVAGTYLAVAEGMALGVRAGLNMEKVLKALSGGSAASWALTNRAPRMIAGEYPLGFKVSLHRKDLKIALAAAEELGADLKAATLVANIEDTLISQGLGDSDIAAIAHSVVGSLAGGVAASPSTDSRAPAAADPPK